MIPILVLAGGSSSRMGAGRDKLLEPVDGQPLLRLLSGRALATGHPVFVALPPDRPDREAVLADLDVTILRLSAAGEGMSGTMRAAVCALPPCEALLMLLADLPEITTGDMAEVIAARTSASDNLIWRGATPDGQPGHPILFDARLRPEFANLSGDSGGEALVKPLLTRTHLVQFDTPRARRDLDTPEDWDGWRRETGR